MSRIVIVTDSTVTIPENLVNRYNIQVLPQTLVWGSDTYRDQIDITPDAFYTRLETSKTLPTTAQITPTAFQTTFSKLLEQGDHVLAIVVSEKLSGTLASALQAKEMLPGTHLEIVDSQSTSMAMGFIILAAARAAEEGASLAECKAIAERARAHTGIFFVVDTLKYLHMGGRIGGGVRFLGTALDLKPIMELRDGRIEAVERVRTKRKALNRLVELVDQRIGDRKPIRLSVLHAKAEEEGQTLLETASQRFQSVQNVFTEISPVVGTHVGPGTVGLAFMAGM